VKFFTSVLLAFLVIASFAQSETEKLAAIEQGRVAEKQRLLMMKLDSAITLMDAEQYEAADKKFKLFLASIKSVPTDFTYYFGENSYHLGLNRQAVDWLNKYIQLKGTTGKFSEKAADFLKKAEMALLADRAVEVKKATEVLSKNFDIDCGPNGKVVCPVCAGSTVVVRRTYLGESYKTCAYCNKLGFLTCVEYNKLLRGQLNPVGN
jgi:hypothetical protein